MQFTKEEISRFRRRMFWLNMREAAKAALLFGLLFAIGATNTLGGFAARASIAAPCAWAKVCSEKGATRFVLDAHFIPLPTVFEMPEGSR